MLAKQTGEKESPTLNIFITSAQKVSDLYHVIKKTLSLNLTSYAVKLVSKKCSFVVCICIDLFQRQSAK